MLAALMDQVCRQRDERGEGEELGLPVLHRLLEQRPDIAVRSEHLGGLLVRRLLGDELDPPGDRRANLREDIQREDCQGQAAGTGPRRAVRSSHGYADPGRRNLRTTEFRGAMRSPGVTRCRRTSRSAIAAAVITRTPTMRFSASSSVAIDPSATSRVVAAAGGCDASSSVPTSTVSAIAI